MGCRMIRGVEDAHDGVHDDRNSGVDEVDQSDQSNEMTEAHVQDGRVVGVDDEASVVDAEDMAGADGEHERVQDEGGVHDKRRDGMDEVDQSGQSKEMVEGAEDTAWMVDDGLQDGRRDGEDDIDQSGQSNGVVDAADDG